MPSPSDSLTPPFRGYLDALLELAQRADLSDKR
jgi:hypothetical protein